MPEPEITNGLIVWLLKSIEQSTKLEKITNQELADLLVEHVWKLLPLGGYSSDIIYEAIERLRKDELHKPIHPETPTET